MKLLLIFWTIFGIAVAYDLGGVMSGNKMAGVPLGFSLGEGQLDVEGICTRAGTACLNCTHAVTCISLPVGYLMVPLHECPEDQTCNARQGGCVNEPVPECDYKRVYEHKCEQVGIFPDAYDCRKFHLCSPPVDEPSGKPADHRTALCPRHYAYNPYIAQCSISLPYGQCESRTVPECTTIGQAEVLSNTPNYYYVCLSKKGALYPQIFMCPHGRNFSGGFCLSEEHTSKKTTEKPEQKEAATEDQHISYEPIVRITEYPPDTFLADKFDLTNYDTIDDRYIPHASYEFSSSSVESF